jgi:hypothetical protein
VSGDLEPESVLLCASTTASADPSLARRGKRRAPVRGVHPRRAAGAGLSQVNPRAARTGSLSNEHFWHASCSLRSVMAPGFRIGAAPRARVVRWGSSEPAANPGPSTSQRRTDATLAKGRGCVNPCLPGNFLHATRQFPRVIMLQVLHAAFVRRVRDRFGCRAPLAAASRNGFPLVIARATHASRAAV